MVSQTQPVKEQAPPKPEHGLLYNVGGLFVLLGIAAMAMGLLISQGSIIILSMEANAVARYLFFGGIPVFILGGSMVYISGESLGEN